MNTIHRSIRTAACMLAVICLGLGACERSEPLAPTPETDDYFDKSLEIVYQYGNIMPAEQATIALGGEPLTFWPYTGVTFEDTPVDPINVVFAGQADPRQIRAALLALDGDRTAFGYPDAPPFNARWQDALGGDVHTACAVDGHGWQGSVVQLTLGDYGPIRFHLRLFRTGCSCASGCWTLGGAHFELQIPGTTEHEVLSWEKAEQLIMVDMLRSGLLDPDLPMLPTGPINATPSYRTIRMEIYNLLPPDLIEFIEGPPQPVSAPVPLPSDGQGTIFNLAGSAQVTPEQYTASAVIEFDQLVPRPFCSDGPGDFLLITGPVTFSLTTEVDAALDFRSRSDYIGELMAQPFDLSDGTPVPVGDPFPARVMGTQQVSLGAGNCRVLTLDRRFTREIDGPQILAVQLEVPQRGLKSYISQLRCIDD